MMGNYYYQVKLLSSSSPDLLEQRANKFLAEHEADEVYDLQFSASEGMYYYSITFVKQHDDESTSI